MRQGKTAGSPRGNCLASLDVVPDAFTLVMLDIATQIRRPTRIQSLCSSPAETLST